MALPKFNQEVRNIIREELSGRRIGCEAMVVAYHPNDRTVDLVLNKPNTQKPGEYLEHVPIPITLGVQEVEPISGQYCFVSFKDGNPRQPFVTSFYSTSYSDTEYRYHETIFGITPRFLNKF
jgi:hypothetical protein